MKKKQTTLIGKMWGADIKVYLYALWKSENGQIKMDIHLKQEMISTFCMSINTVNLAVSRLKKFGLIEKIEGGRWYNIKDIIYEAKN